MTDCLYLIDGSAYVWRAFHALPATTRRLDGLPINAVKGFCEMLWKFVGNGGVAGDRATHLAVVFDHVRSRTFRQDIFPEYKAQRPAPPPEIVPQFALIRRAVKAFGIACIERDGFEADDLIATYAEQARPDMRVVIVTGDKDMFQLVTDRLYDVRVWNPFWKPPPGDPDQTWGKMFDERAVREKMGVSPAGICDLQALTGDTADNIPGVKGIGPKIAQELLAQFGTLERVLRNAPYLKQKARREALTRDAEAARMSRVLVELKRDIDVDMPVDEMEIFPPDPNRLVGFLKAADLHLADKVATRLGVDLESVEPEPRTAAPGANTRWEPNGR